MKAVFIATDGLVSVESVPDKPEHLIRREVKMAANASIPRLTETTVGIKFRDYILSEIVHLRERCESIAIYEEKKT